jgi:hypothetical protein
LVLTLVLISSTSLFSQNKERKKVYKIDQSNLEFPFDKTIKIKIVSFEYFYQTVSESFFVSEMKYNETVPKINNKLDSTRINEIEILEINKVIELIEILNQKPKNQKSIASSSNCFNPRNSIVFLDENDTIIEHIDLCFECLNYKIFSKEKFIDFEVEKMLKLKLFFSENGVQFGTNN